MGTSKIVYLTCLGASVCLIIAGFIVPPTGVVDGSVLTAVGELLGFAALALGYKALEEGRSTVIKHGQTEVTFSDKDDE